MKHTGTFAKQDTSSENQLLGGELLGDEQKKVEEDSRMNKENTSNKKQVLEKEGLHEAAAEEDEEGGGAEDVVTLKVESANAPQREWLVYGFDHLEPGAGPTSAIKIKWDQDLQIPLVIS